MPSEQFQRQVSTPRDRARIWESITDVDLLMSWVSVLSGVTEHEHLERYTAILTDRIGMFALSADLEITVVGLSESSFIAVEAEGRDRQVDSRIFVEGSIRLSESPDGTDVTVLGRYEVTGRVATFGGPMIRSKAEKLIDEFISGLSDHLT